jgi:hypothetical protein
MKEYSPFSVLLKSVDYRAGMFVFGRPQNKK